MTETYYLLPRQRNLRRRNLSEQARNTWHGGIVENGLARWESLKTTSKKTAMDWYSKMQAQRYSPKAEEAKPVDIEAASGAFMLDMENVRRRVSGTLRLYRMYLAQFKAFCGRRGIKDMRDVSAPVCSEFAQEAFKGCAPTTNKNKIIFFRHLHGWIAERYGIGGRNPFKKIVVPSPKPRPRDFWTVEQCEKIIDAAPNEECKCWFALMAFAGLRREEARHLKIESFDFESWKFSLVGKGGKYAALPISTRLRSYIENYLAARGAEPGALFPELSKLSKAREGIIKAAVEKSGIQSEGLAHFHRFRHSFASNLLRAGKGIKAVQMLMRHEDATLTLRIYGHLLPSDLEQAAEL